MTNATDSTADERFEAAIANYNTARAAARAIEELDDCEARCGFRAIFKHATDSFLAIPSPSLGALASKLELWWGEDLFDEADIRSEWRQQIIGDIRRIERQLAGVEEPDASGGMDLSRLAAKWRDALQAVSRWELLLEEGPSDVWINRGRQDIVDFLRDARAALLSHPAATLDGVAKKMTLLMIDDLEPSGIHPSILHDLRRFAATHTH